MTPELLDILLVVLGHDAVRHRRALDRDELDERRPGHEHSADVDAEMAREAIDLGAQLEQPLPPVPRRMTDRDGLVLRRLGHDRGPLRHDER